MTEPSLSRIIEEGLVDLEVLHPGGFEITEELAKLCEMGEGKLVLDVACGSGATASFLAERFGCKVIGVDLSERLLERARHRIAERIRFVRGDANNLPFRSDVFDATISECTLCMLEKIRALREMVRVTKRGGYVGIHDLCWIHDPPERIRISLEEEGERPETLAGWVELFESLGLEDVVAIDRTSVWRRWEKRIMREIGILGILKLGARILREFGPRGILKIARSWRSHSNESLGYCIVVGRKI